MTAPTTEGDLPSVTLDAVEDEPSVPLDIVEEWGKQSFPASDPPANW